MTMSMKKIVYIVGDLSYPNGMSRVLSQKVNYLARHTGWQLYVVLTEGKDKPFYYPLEPNVQWVNFGLEFDTLYNVPLWRRVPVFIRRQRRYRQLLTDYLFKVRPDVTVTVLRREINFINDINDGSQKVGEIHFNKQSYRTFSKSWLPTWVNNLVTHRWQKALERQVRRLAHFVVLTQEDYQMWAPVFSAPINPTTPITPIRLSIIPNPIYTYPDEASDCTSHRVIAVGRYTWQKGFDLLIQAWKEVEALAPKWQLHIYGAGDPTAFRQMAMEDGVGDTLFCEEATSDVYVRYRESSIFVLSSRYEGFGLVMVEAMSCGIPVVAFACPCGPRDVISDGTDGLLIANGDTHALANGLLRLMNDASLRQRMGQAAREKARRYMEPPIMKQWIELFEGVTSFNR